MTLTNTSEFSAMDAYFMQRALQCARRGGEENEVPVGAILVHSEKIIAEAWNAPIKTVDPTSHAEILAIRKAAEQLNNYRLVDSTLYVTLEPCAMCAGAIVQARIARVVFAAFDERAGSVESVFPILTSKKLNHHVICQGGLYAQESISLLRDFFQKKRQKIQVPHED